MLLMRKLCAFSLSVIIFFTSIANSVSHNDDRPSRSTETKQQTANGFLTSRILKKSKPIIYTFYYEIGSEEDKEKAGKEIESDRVLLRIWKDEWHNAGWAPRVLTLEDARQHTHFVTLNRMLQDLKLRDNDYFNFMRWLAMSNQPNGGFMANYDTFPLAGNSDSIPNKGRLTVYDSGNSEDVPSLISGSQHEWFRFAWALVEIVSYHRQAKDWDSKKAMQYIYAESKGKAYLLSDGVLPGQTVLHGRGYPEDTCNKTSKAFAVHFSRYAVENGILPKEAINGTQTQASTAEEWLGGWRKNCEFRSALPHADDEIQLASSHGFDEVGSDSLSLQPINNIDTTLLSIDTKEVSYNNKYVAQNYKEPRDSDLTDKSIQMNHATASRTDKPVIFTFYEDTNLANEMGMMSEGSQEIIQAWARTWSEIGWDPRVLDFSVARKHHQFDKFDKVISDLPFESFDRISFYRYLAAAMAGGGWVSDFDIYPLNRTRWPGKGDPSFLPNNGNLTVYELSKNGGIPVPSLISGNENEWFRMAKSLVESAKSHNAEFKWNDVKAMQDLYKKSKSASFEVQDSVIIADASSIKQDISKKLCKDLLSKLAIHFPPSIMNEGQNLKRPESTQLRASFARSWIKEYRKVCLDNVVP